ncbi:MAG: methyltransferase domain-containing protein [Reinekea sp.]|jgi:23S rRNA (guanine745-N1)-methyltransferase
MRSIYACPVCLEPLTLINSSWQCPTKHSFDRHRKGYVNLLAVQRKRSKEPGDNADMIQRRREFLEAGYYRPLAQALAETCKFTLSPDATLLDAGCGEGYYTNTIAQLNPDFCCHGLDISKVAIQAAAKYKNVEWCVASSTYPPYLPNSFDAIISIFSRVDSQPFANILKPGGKILMVTPDTNHLHALRTLIYDQVQPYDISKHKNYFDNHFHLKDEQNIHFNLLLEDAEAIQNLLGMTPHAHHLSESAKEKLSQTNKLHDQACFKLYCFEYSEN